MKKQNIEVEGSEIAMKNQYGDLIIIPKDKVQEAKTAIEKGDHSAIDEMASGLPYMAEYAEDGSYIPGGGVYDPIFNPRGKQPINYDNKPKQNKASFRDDIIELPSSIEQTGIIQNPLSSEDDKLDSESVRVDLPVENKKLISYVNNETKTIETDTSLTESSYVQDYNRLSKNNIDYNEKLKEEKINLYYKNYNKDNENDVKKIQNELIKKGYNLNRFGADGKFGDETKLAYNKMIEDESNSMTKKFDFNLIKNKNKINDKRCAVGMCKLFEEQGFDTIAMGIKYKNAWDINSNMNKHGGSSIYNIYESYKDSFKGIKSGSELKRITKEVKKKSQTDASMYKINDIVGLYYDASSHHAETLRSKTHNTHVGFVSGFKTINGKKIPIITHNIGGTLHHDRYDRLVTTWINRPNSNRGYSYKGKESEVEEINTSQYISNIEKKIERKMTDNEKNVSSKMITRAFHDSKYMTEELESNIDKDWLAKAVIGITGVETAIGINAVRKKEEIEGIHNVALKLKNVEDKDISIGVGKMKLSTIDEFGKKFLGLSSINDLSNDDTSIDAITYNTIKNYEEFNNYRNKFPELELTEEDVRNMTILAHNQNVSRLLNTGRVKDLRTFKEELKDLRNLYHGNISDISSTNFKYLGFIGKMIFNNIKEGEEGSETYISKTNRYINEIF